jgi:hypothetical protein
MSINNEEAWIVKKINCWEAMKCGLEPGGKRAKEFGVCPATVKKALNGVNEGINGGRSCWALLGTLCHGVDGIPRTQETYTQKLARCTQCRFYELVAIQQDDELIKTEDIFKILDKKEETSKCSCSMKK